MRIHFVLSLVVATAGAACASSQAEQVKDAHNERIDDNTVARTRTIEDQEAARVEGIDREKESTERQLDDASETHSKQDVDDAKKVVEDSSDRATYQTKATARIQTIGVRIDAAQQKLKALGAKAPANQSSELESLRREHALLSRDLKALPEIPASNWDKEHEALDKRISELNRRVKLLTESAEGA
jgi:preprotein translocase subunit SecD